MESVELQVTPYPSSVNQAGRLADRSNDLGHDRTTRTCPGLEMDPSEVAVMIRGAYKQYQQFGVLGTQSNMVIKGLDMTVPKGTIYGLLGASGCGKTTILRAIVGQCGLTAGEVRVMGREPGTPGSGIPGTAVGYMPQELALYGGFTIGETLRYFGWLTNMGRKDLDKRKAELLKFLDLPAEDRMITKLSGGQKRRVSFAVALLHRPPVLILDEPTVGVDPVLRQRIWEHLMDIVADGRTTVLITTHYIEEARQAHTIGLMRQGVLLDEDNPDSLLERYACPTMEEVFLKLSIRQACNSPDEEDSDRNQNCSALTALHQAHIDTDGKASRGASFEMTTTAPPDPQLAQGSAFGRSALNLPLLDADPSQPRYPDTTSHLGCLLWKQLLWMRRNIPMVCFLLLLPAVQSALIGVTVGNDPKGLNLALVNDEGPCTPRQEIMDNLDCMAPSQMSCVFVRLLKDQDFIAVPYDNEEAAKGAVQAGHAWFAMHISPNFTDSIIARIQEGGEATNETLVLSEINVWMDMSNSYIAGLSQTDMTFATVDFIRSYMTQCGLNPAAADIPIRLEEPVYGSRHPRFLDFVAPGAVLTLIFFMSLASAVGALISEKTEGLLERSMVMGVTMREVMWAHIITQTVIMALQAVIVLVAFFELFHITNIGPLPWVVILCVLQGACGMCLGMLVSSVCKSDMEATLVSLGSFFPFIFLSGMMWPIEGMHWTLRYAGWGLPLTLATTSLRHMLTRGWNLDKPEVLYGFLSTSLWIAIFLVITLFVLRVQKR